MNDEYPRIVEKVIHQLKTLANPEEEEERIVILRISLPKYKWIILEGAEQASSITINEAFTDTIKNHLDIQEHIAHFIAKKGLKINLIIAKLIKRKTKDGLIEVLDEIELGKEYLIDLDSIRMMDGISIEEYPPVEWKREMVRVVDGSGYFMPTELITWEGKDG